MRTNVDSLPFDIVHAISVLLDIRSYINLGRINKRFYQLLKDENTARKCLEANALYNRNVAGFLDLEPGHSARRALSLTFDQQDAIRSASPYSASTLAYGADFIYHQGVLCYISRGQIRILDTFHRSRDEICIGETPLRAQLTNDMGLTNLAEDLLRHTTLLRYADGILVLRCEEDTGPGSWLFALDLQPYKNDNADNASFPRIRLRRRLLSKTKLFVRHTRDYLYFGIHSALREDGHHEWLIQGCSLATGQLISPKPLRLEEFVGSEVGSTACFEIHNGKFYALSNQTSFDTEEVDWTSCYHYVRFGVDDPTPDLKLHKAWRRQHREGPINDAWTELCLHPNEQSNVLNIIEVRKEWLGGGSLCTRTSYTTNFNDTEDADLMLNRPNYNHRDQLSRTLDEHSKPSFLENPPIRIPRNHHQEYSPNTNPSHEFLRARTKHRRYDPAAHAFLDLVTDTIPQPNTFRTRDRLRLRIASRVLASPLTSGDVPNSSIPQNFQHDSHHHDLRPKIFDNNLIEIPDSDLVFTDTQVAIWPPPDAPASLFELLCPGGRVGNVQAVSDDRSVVYMAGVPNAQHDYERAIIMLSFDPAWGHKGLKKLYSGDDRDDHSHEENDKSSQKRQLEAGAETFIVADSQREDMSVREGKRARIDQAVKRTEVGSIIAAGGGGGSSSSSSSISSEKKERKESSFLRKEPAMYLSLQHGFWLR